MKNLIGHFTPPRRRLTKLAILKLLFPLFPTLFLANFLYAQNLSLADKIKDTDIIFEGTVLSKSSFWNEDHSMIYTSNFVLADKIYKGEINQPIVEIVTIGGVLEQEMLIAQHAANLTQDENILFFCSKKIYNQLDLDRNVYRIKYEENGIIRLPATEIEKIKLRREEFENKDKLSQFIEKQTQQAYRHIPNETIWSSFCDNSFSFMHSKQPKIFLSFANPSITIAENILEFDVMISSDVEGVQLGNVDLFINYSNETFGDNIVGNNLVEIEKGEIAISDKYKLNISDRNSNTARIKLEALENGNFGILSNTEQSLFKIRASIENIESLANISFDELAIAGNIYYHCRGEFFPFEQIGFSSPLDAIFPPQGEEVKLNYGFERVKIIDDGAKVEFYVSAESELNSTISKGEVYLQYNKSAFGESVVSNERVKVKLTSEFKNYYNIECRDISENTLAIRVSSKNIDVLETSPSLESKIIKSIIKVELDIQECKSPGKIRFRPNAMQNKSAHFVTNRPFNQEFYSPIVANDDIDVRLCNCPKPEISVFSPDRIPAGMNEILTITGNNFGDWDVDNSRVIFPNGDDGGSSDAVAEIGDILSWENERIEVIVPSVTNGQVWKNPACSGRIKVVNICGEDTSDEDLNIPYAVLNRRSIATRPADKIVVREQNSNGLTFEFSQNLGQDKRNAFREALDEWCIETSIEYKISNTESPLTAAAAGDGTNLISIEEVTTTGGNAALLLATAYFESCPNPDNNSLGWTMTDLDIKIDPSVGNSMSDFQLIKNRILHELGHAHMLHHSKRLGVNPIFPQDQYIVFFDITDINTDPTNPIAKIEMDDAEGANLLFSNSVEVINNTMCGNPIHQGICGSGTNSTNSIYSADYLEIYPNPSLGKFNIELKDINLIDSALKIHSMEGVLVYNKKIDSHSIEINGLASGIYIVEILNGDTSFVNKIVITNE